MAQITKETANETLKNLCDEFATEYLSKARANKQAYETAIGELKAAGKNLSEITEKDLADHGYTKALSDTVKTYLEGCAKTLQNRNKPTGFHYDCNIRLTADGKGQQLHYLEYDIQVFLKPDENESGNVYSGTIGLNTVSDSDKYLLSKNPGDSTGGTLDKTKKENDPKKNKISALEGASSDAQISETFTPPVFTNDQDRQANAEAAKQHPERVVDGIYYADDATLEQAKKYSEEHKKIDTSEGSAAGTAAAQKLVEAMKAVNTTLYGTENEEVIKQLQGSVGSLELNSVLGTAISVRNRQKLLNFKKFKYDYKKPNSGKPPQNKDPYPVDQKIEEFETHQPKVKVYAITTYVHAQAPAVALLQQFDATEKRLVRLENNLATLTRYFYRLGARVPINCVYYGGQTTFEKGNIDISLSF